ncbi:MAG: PLP-dependent aminotransferase family protein [Acidimicrobiales bacterium]
MWIDLYLDPGVGRRTSAELFGQIRHAIVTGRLAPGDRLPPSRQLATELGVARSTVTTVYGRLGAEGFVEGRAGAGTVVAAVATRPASDAGRGRRPSALAPRRSPAAGVTLLAAAPGPSPVRIDLRTGSPDPALFPVADWRRVVTGVVRHPPPGYGPAAGLPELRQAIARWIGRWRGVDADPAQVVVTAGAQHAFELCAQVLVAPGDVVALEDPGYPPARALFERHGARIAPVPVDGEGMVVDRVPTAARLVLVTPSHQAPTAVVMSAARRRALLARAGAAGMAVIEDDYDTEYRYVDRPLEPLHLLDVEGRVIYVGTFSKSLSPSLRLGFAVLPEPLVGAVERVRTLSDHGPPHLLQAALARFLSDGFHDTHLRRVGREYRRRHRVLIDGLDDLARAGLVSAPVGSAGLHVAVGLPPDTDEAQVVAALAGRGVAVNGTAGCWHRPSPPPGLSIGFGLATPAALDEAIGLLGEVLAMGPA